MTTLEKINNLTWFDLINKLKSIFKDLLPKEEKYKKYIAVLDQQGTDAPTATVLENTLGETPTYAYGSPGSYYLNTVGDFFNENTYILIGSLNGGNTQMLVYFNGTNQIGVDSYFNNILMDNILDGVTIEIRVYN